MTVSSQWAGSSVQQLIQPPVGASVTNFAKNPNTHPITGACSLMHSASTQRFTAGNELNPQLKAM